MRIVSAAGKQAVIGLGEIVITVAGLAEGADDESDEMIDDEGNFLVINGCKKIKH